MKTCCIEGCNCEADPGRKYCHKHFLQRKAEQRKAKKALGQKVRTMYKCVCCNCNKEFEGFRKDSLFCSRKCFNSFNHKQKNQYVYDSKNYRNCIWQHRNIAEKVLNKKLNTNQVVHHLDCNPKNNELTNLIVMTRQAHAKLHFYLNRQRALLERSNNGNAENCWNNLIIPMTTAWLETTSAKVQKLWEIGQSAAELQK